MIDLAGWAPNPHALIVHLPIGLLVSAAALDLLVLLQRNRATTAGVATGLYIAGTLALVAAYVTGRAAAPAVYTPGLAQAIVAQHWDRAFWCVWYFGLVASGRLARHLWGPSLTRTMAAGLGLASLAGFVLLATTAELGARLVYEHGVGVAAPDVSETLPRIPSP